MRILITFAILITFVASLNAQTLSNVNVNGTVYNITYSEGITFNSQQTTIDDAPWWGNLTLSAAFANAANTNNLRFAYSEQSYGGTEFNNYQTNAGANNAASTSTGNYAVSAVAVPAPLPILGILPVVGFLKRMRKRQRA